MQFLRRLSYLTVGLAGIFRDRIDVHLVHEGKFLLMPFTDRLDAAFVFAHRLHRDQTRKGSDRPYITHLLTVAGIVAEYGGDEDQIIAALLHDTVEDQGGRPILDEIRNEFGENVAAYVEACTDAFVHPKPPWRERKESFLRSLVNVPEAAYLIITADKVHNIRSMIADLETIGPRLWDRFNVDRDQILWYHREICLELTKRWKHPLLDELSAAVETLARKVEASEIGTMER